jgi:hypothetical protein
MMGVDDQAIADALVKVLSGEDIPGLAPEAREALKGLRGPQLPRELVLRAEAVVAQQKAAELYDEADRIEYRAGLAEAAEKAAMALADAEAEVERLTEGTKIAVGLERQAQDLAA